MNTTGNVNLSISLYFGPFRDCRNHCQTNHSKYLNQSNQIKSSTGNHSVEPTLFIHNLPGTSSNAAFKVPYLLNQINQSYLYIAVVGKTFPFILYICAPSNLYTKCTTTITPIKTNLSLPKQNTPTPPHLGHTF